MITSHALATEMNVPVDEVFQLGEETRVLLDLVRPVQYVDDRPVYEISDEEADVIRRHHVKRTEAKQVLKSYYGVTPAHLRDDIPDMFARNY